MGYRKAKECTFITNIAPKKALLKYKIMVSQSKVISSSGGWNTMKNVLLMRGDNFD